MANKTGLGCHIPAGASVSVVTFNVLAPCYNKSEGGRHAADDPAMRRKWLQRHRTRVICETIAQLHADVVCLQEFWFSPAFCSLYETEMARLGFAASPPPPKDETTNVVRTVCYVDDAPGINPSCCGAQEIKKTE